MLIMVLEGQFYPSLIILTEFLVFSYNLSIALKHPSIAYGYYPVSPKIRASRKSAPVHLLEQNLISDWVLYYIILY